MKIDLLACRSVHQQGCGERDAAKKLAHKVQATRDQTAAEHRIVRDTERIWNEGASGFFGKRSAGSPGE